MWNFLWRGQKCLRHFFIPTGLSGNRDSLLFWLYADVFIPADLYMFNTIRSTVSVAFFLTLLTAAFSPSVAQTTESLAVESIAPDAPGYMAEMARADDFREPDKSAEIESQPYDLAYALTGAPKSALPVGRQPTGALSDKVVFAMAGHGWTYDDDRMYYYTQRGLSHGVVEDMGNADQMHIFAHLLFNTGATVVPLRPVDKQPNERVIDNAMAQVEFFGDWRAGSSDRYFGNADDEVPYAISDASLLESAVARYRPYIPEAGYYPVYVWARDGSDRSNQLYRVNHTGGTTEVRVDWRQVGKAWVWLGTYYFNEGDAGYVEVSNQVTDPYATYHNHVVVADAVRFGNGHGDVPRPGGISGYGREDEGDNYWIERSLGVGADRRIFDAGRDGSSTVSSPPKAAAHMNRETHGSFFDRLLISFHSNAATGRARGTVALYNASPARRPSYQETLAELIGDQLNTQMSAELPPGKDDWSPRERNTYSGINFGELRRDYVQNEMSATIVETGFHDNAEDAVFLLDPRSRIEMAEATLQGVFNWYSSIENPKAAATMPPTPPVAIAATINDGKIEIKWKAGSVGPFDGGPPINFIAYRSPDGFGFDGGTPASPGAETITVDPLSTSGVTFLRMTALNDAGESFPSQTIAVAPARNNAEKNVAAKTILFTANTVLDSTTNIPYALDGQPGGGPYRPGSVTHRVRALYTLLEPSGAAEALTMAASGVGFDGADTAAYATGMVDMDPYNRIVLTTSQQNPKSPLFSADILQSLGSFVNNGGKLLITGSGFAENISNSGKAGRDFLSNVCGITGNDQVVSAPTATSLDDRFLTKSLSLQLVAQNRPWAEQMEIQPANFQLRKGRSLGLIEYNSGGAKGFGAALTRPGYSEGEVLVMGFPLALVKDSDIRTQLMGAMLKQL